MARVEHRGFNEIGDSAMSQAEANGIADPLKLKEIREDAIKQEIYKIGRKSEKRFLDLIFEYPYASFVRIGSHADDLEQGVDFWLKLDTKFNLPLLPVQVKSSDRDAKRFKKNDTNYENAQRTILVLNAGPSVKSKKLFINELEAEINRVRQILENHPNMKLITPMIDKH